MKKIMIDGKETELRFVYDDSARAYFKTWKKMIDFWTPSYGSRAAAERYIGSQAVGTIVAGREGHSFPLVSAKHSGICTAAEKQELFKEALKYNNMSSIEV